MSCVMVGKLNIEGSLTHETPLQNSVVISTGLVVLEDALIGVVPDEDM